MTMPVDPMGSKAVLGLNVSDTGVPCGITVTVV
jgi:hypothetical protein